MLNFRRKIVYDMFYKFPKTNKQHNFMAVVRFDTVSLIIETVIDELSFRIISANLPTSCNEYFIQAQRFGLTSPVDQWLVIIPDMNMGPFNLDTFSGLISEGENFSFIVNKSTHGKTCIVRMPSSLL